MADALTFRETDGTRWGAGKGANLTPAEVDINFWFLWQLILAVQASAPAPVEISNVRQEGNQIYFDMEDSTVWGPFTLPSAVAEADVLEHVESEFTLAPTDSGKFILCSYPGGAQVIVPGFDDVPFAQNTEIHFRQENTNSPIVFHEGASGVTIDGMEGRDLSTDAQGSVVTLKKLDGADRWCLFGSLAQAGESES